MFCLFRQATSARCADHAGPRCLKTEVVSHEPSGPEQVTRRETVNVVLTAVLLAGLVCLLILGGVAGGSGGPADPRPSTEAPLTNGSHRLAPTPPAATSSPG